MNGEAEFEVHPALQGSGESEGLEIWRIEKFEPVKQETSTFGKFYEGDSYVVLSTKKAPGQSKFEYHIHFWLGKKSTQDELGSAAIRAVELDEYLNGAATQHREAQGHESKLFLSYFKEGIKYVKGGVKSGFNEVDLTKFEKRLFQVKGKRNVRVEQVECKCGSLNQGDVFILDCGPNIFVWIGPKSSKIEKIKGANIARKMRDEEKAGRAHIHIIDKDWDSNEFFFKSLGSRDKTIKAAEAGGDDIDMIRMAEREMTLYKVLLDNDKPDIEEVTVRPFKRAMLKSEHCYVLDSGFGGIFVWTGKVCPFETRKKVWKGVHTFIAERGFPAWINVTRVVEGGESPIFQQYFSDWEQNEAVMPREIKGNVASQNYDGYDGSNLHNSAPKLKDFMPDDGSGTVQIWRIENFNMVSVPEEAYGFFFGGDSYVILYTYERDDRKNYIIYFWQGLKSSIDEKGTSALKAIELDDKLGGEAVQIRVVMNKEPAHFMKIFKGKVVYFMGGHVSGFRNVHDRDNYDPNATILYHVHSDNDNCTRAIQVEARAANLNSNDIFVIETLKNVGVWVGKNANEQEVEMTKLMCEFLAPHRGEPLIYEEGSESSQFWDVLGGREKYYSGPSKEKSLKMPTRLFHCSNASGKFLVEEIVEFNQQDLEEDDVMILDNYDEIFIWIGRGANDFEKREALKTAYSYLNSDPTGRNENNTMIIVVKQCFEPPQFTGHFHPWDKELWNHGMTFDEILKEVGEENAEINLLEDEVKKYTSFYPLEVLQRKLPPEGVDVTCKELYLNDEDFQNTFGMTKEYYETIPQWKKVNLRKQHNLF